MKWICRKVLGTSNITYEPTPTATCEERGPVGKGRDQTSHYINGFHEQTVDNQKSPLTVLDEGDVTEMSQL